MSRSFYAHPLGRLIIDHNPFFLLSAASMLVACRLLLSALLPRPGQAGKVLMLVGTLNLYELLLIVLALFLLSRPACFRDVRILLILEALFLVDVTFLNSELYSANLTAGVVANVVLFGLAALKLGAVRDVAGLRDPRTFGFALGTVGLLLAIPGVLAYWEKARDGSVTAFTIYGFWWLAGAVPVVAAWLLRDVAWTKTNDPWTSAVRGAFVGLPFVSVLAHLWGASWVYDAGFHFANLAPVLLGLAILAPRVVGATNGEAARIGLPIVAVFLSVSGHPLGGEVGAWLGRSRFSPERLVIIASAAIYLYHAWEFRRPLLATLVTLVGGMWVLTRLPSHVWRSIATVVSTLSDWLLSMLPRTAMHWGVVTLVAAFGLLGIGLSVSLKKPTAEPVNLPEK